MSKKPFVIVGHKNLDAPYEYTIVFSDTEENVMWLWGKYHPNYFWASRRPAEDKDFDKYEIFSENLMIIKKEFEEHKGEFVLTQSHKLERFIGLGYDQEDYYWITFDGTKLTWNTCVGSLIYLKGKIDEKDYNEFVRCAKLNHNDCATWIPDAAKEEFKKELLELKDPKSKYLVEPYMELT